MKSQKMINLVTICRKANKLVSGFDAVKEAVVSSNASCVLTASDISPKTLKEINFFCQSSGIPVIPTGLGSADIHYAVGKKAVVMGVNDSGFARKFIELCEEIGK